MTRGRWLIVGLTGAGLALATAGCPPADRKPRGVSNMSDEATVVTGTTRLYGAGGAETAAIASPRVTLDAAGDPTLEERFDAAGMYVLRRRFAGGRVTEEEHFRPNGDVDHRLTFRYDAHGRRAEEVMTFASGAVHGRWVDHRDGGGRLLRREYHDRTDAVVVTETYTFADDGRRAEAVRGAVGTWSYGYDDAGRVIHVEGGPASGDEMDQQVLDYEYDARGRLVHETERGPDGALRRELRIDYPTGR